MKVSQWFVGTSCTIFFSILLFAPDAAAQLLTLSPPKSTESIGDDKGIFQIDFDIIDNKQDTYPTSLVLNSREGSLYARVYVQIPTN